ncbi:MAG: tyrosine-protein phosphatase, partial [Clostridium sp.]|nr:tyrosine-protein phosphatase [Clostridium sp.]
MKYFEEAKCIRLANNKLKITWEEPKNSLVKIYLENDDEELLIERIENSNEVIFTDPDNKRRLLFLLKSEGYNSELVGEKILPFVGVHHFRDIGGYRTIDGRRVKWNTFYRSDKLSDLTEEDIEYFKALGIKTILDLRSKGEVLSSPDPYIEGLKYINISGMSELDNNNGNFDMISIFNQNYLEHFDG